jgi:membrane-bound lytic murein transglycosylase D
LKLFTKKIDFQNPLVLSVLAGLLLILWYLLFLCYCILKGPTSNTVSYSNNNLQVLDLSFPAKLDFCGEEIPKDDYHIRTALSKEFLSRGYWKSNSQILFNRAQRWFPYIEPILKQESVPDDFKYLAVIESHLSNVHSDAGAAGFWQLLSSSARVFGLEVSTTVDERLHIEKSTRAACKLIKAAYAVFRNWTLTAAAYNRGINGLLKAMKDQNTQDYHRLLLNPETGSFVYRILAYKTLLSNPGHFGIKKRKFKNFPKINYKIIPVDSSIGSLEHFANYLHVSKMVLKGHNPWLIEDRLENPEHKKFEIRIPKNLAVDYSSYFSDLVPGWFIPLRQDTVIKDSTEVDSHEVSVFIHEETEIVEIAKRFHLNERELRKWNGWTDKQNSVKSQSVLVVEPKAH